MPVPTPNPPTISVLPTQSHPFTIESYSTARGSPPLLQATTPLLQASVPFSQTNALPSQAPLPVIPFIASYVGLPNPGPQPKATGSQSQPAVPRSRYNEEIHSQFKKEVSRLSSKLENVEIQLADDQRKMRGELTLNIEKNALSRYGIASWR